MFLFYSEKDVFKKLAPKNQLSQRGCPPKMNKKRGQQFERKNFPEPLVKVPTCELKEVYVLISISNV